MRANQQMCDGAIMEIVLYGVWQRVGTGKLD